MASGSVAVRRSLGRRLKALREQAGKRAVDIEEAGIAGRTKLHRIENTTASIRIPDVQALCLLYGTSDTTRDELVAMARNTSGPGWWEDFGDAVPTWFTMYVELEAAASDIVSWQSVLVPGLLQTPAYQAALPRPIPVSAETAARQIRVRTERQRAVLDRANPLSFSAIIDEGVLGRSVGEPDVMREQREHLIKMSARGHVAVRVLPWSAGAHVAMGGAFNVMGFINPEDPDVAYLETEVGGRYFEQSSVVDRYRVMFDSLHKMSIPIEEFTR